jgi:hypothetical protein
MSEKRNAKEWQEKFARQIFEFLKFDENFAEVG